MIGALGARLPGLCGHAVVVQADAAALATALHTAGVRPALVLIDPPFATHRAFHTAPRASGASTQPAYTDRWPSLDVYLGMMRDVVVRVHALLDDEGSLIVHCDHHASPYLAVLCDEVFGMGDRGPRAHAPGFRNELIWTYGLGGSSARCYPKKHDTLLWYTKSARWTFAPPRVPATSSRLRGQSKKAPDVLAIPALNNMAHERTGYPTQKPLALLDLLVRAHTRPGALVVDLFGGSGTTAVAAVAAGRAAIVGDSAREAILTTIGRLCASGAAVDVYAERPQAADTGRPWSFAWSGDRAEGGVPWLRVAEPAGAAQHAYCWARDVDGVEIGWSPAGAG